MWREREAGGGWLGGGGWVVVMECVGSMYVERGGGGVWVGVGVCVMGGGGGLGGGCWIVWEVCMRKAGEARCG